jgi:hypothetical protein
MKFYVYGDKTIDRKLSKLLTQLDTTVEIQFDLYLDILIANIKRRITDETGPNSELYGKAKEKVFGHQTPYEVTGSLINNIAKLKLPGNVNKERKWSFGIQPVREETYSINLIFEMFRTGKRGLAKDIQKLSTEIAEDLEKNYPKFKFFYKFFGDDAAVIRPRLVEEIDDIIKEIVRGIFK